MSVLNFPMPYQGELIYSTVARYGVHFGICSPKQLLDDIYGNRKVIATVDLPNQLSSVSKLFLDCHPYKIENLIYNHTLFPLYAPFVPEDRRLKCLELMAGSSKGAIHLILGVAASRVKQSLLLRYCPKCMKLQKSQHGEYYWHRHWQVSGANCCLLHGELKEAHVERHSYHRHQFFASSPKACPDIYQKTSSHQSIIVTRQVENLLSRPSLKSPSLKEWTAFYRKLAVINGYAKGNFIKYQEIKKQVLDTWPKKWLVEYDLDINDSQSCWLRSIFRKHRKSFSYLEHIVVLHSFLPDAWDIKTVLNEVSCISVNIKPFTSFPVVNEINDYSNNAALKAENRKSWEELVNILPVSKARNKCGGVYAWLYRHDKTWLLQFNRQHQVYSQPINKRVNWKQRDKIVVRQLIKIRNNFDAILNQPKMSRNWYLFQMKSSTSIEKNLFKLPLCEQFFNRNAESVTDYQIRRITKIIIQEAIPLVELKRWKVLRMAGLNEDRLRNGSNEFLQKIVGI